MRTILVAFTWIVVCAGCAASTPPVAPPTTVALAVKAPGDATIGDRTICPVSGEEFVVSATSPKVELDGKTYFFCCADCVTKFQAEPAKYLGKHAAGTQAAE